MSDALQELVRELTREGQLDSQGRFTLAASQVKQRYGELLSVHPELPWLAFLRYGYRVRARRLRCQLNLRECRLSLTGSPELEAIQRAVQHYPQSEDSDTALMHEVIWWFLAQEPEQLCLRVKSGKGHLELRVRPQDFSLQSGPTPMEDEFELRVAWGWRGSLRKAARRAQIQQAVARCLPIFPARVEWDGGLNVTPFRWSGRHRMVLAYLVPRHQAASLPHMALALDMRPTHQLGIMGQRSNDHLVGLGQRSNDHLVGLGQRFNDHLVGPEGLDARPVGARDCDWLVLRQKHPGDVAVDGERTRIRLLFRYGIDGQPARFLPVKDGCLLQPIELDWIQGVTVLCACPPDLKTDLTGLKLVEGPELQEFLRHLRCRWIQEIQSLQDQPQFDLGPLAQALEQGSP